MPEGDTIHRAARELGAVLVERPLMEIALPRLAGPVPPPGVATTQVLARGKHLLVHLDDGHVIHTHLAMTGRWQVRHQPARRPPTRVLRVWLATAEHVGVCTDAPTAALLDEAAVARHPGLRALGPDLCLSDVDLDEVVRRAQARAVGRCIADLLLDQRVAAGIGNVYKAEVLHLHRVHPATPATAVGPQALRDLFATAGRLLRANLTGGARTTVPGGPPGALWVYGRSARACRTCGTSLDTAPIGQDARTTTWCPTCQPDPQDRPCTSPRPAR